MLNYSSKPQNVITDLCFIQHIVVIDFFKKSFIMKATEGHLWLSLFLQTRIQWRVLFYSTSPSVPMIEFTEYTHVLLIPPGTSAIVTGDLTIGFDHRQSTRSVSILVSTARNPHGIVASAFAFHTCFDTRTRAWPVVAVTEKTFYDLIFHCISLVLLVFRSASTTFPTPTSRICIPAIRP